MQGHVEPFPTTGLPRPPSAYGDRTVAQIRTKYETRLSRRFDEEADARLVASVLGSRDRLRRGKWLERGDVARMESHFDATYEGAPFLLASNDVFVPGTRTRPRSWSVRKSRLHAAADGMGRTVRLHAALFDASRKAAVYQVRRSIWAWTYHAQERVHERTASDVRADRVLADAILGAAGVLDFLLDGPEEGIVPPRFAIPCGEGLLLGTTDDVPVSFCLARATGINAVRWGNTSMTFGDRVDMVAKSGKPVCRKGFMGTTYVGPDEMRPSQVSARRRMVSACADFADLARAVALGFMAGPSEAGSPSHRDRIRESLPDGEKRDSLRRTLRDPYVLAAMGN